MKKGENIRLDEVLVLKGLCESRSQAKAFIMAGQVWLGTERLEKASKLISPELEIYLKSPMKYVGRGGLKMENFLIHSQIDPSGLRILDIGASTGGFTDCLLQKGACEATCIDVGKLFQCVVVRRHLAPPASVETAAPVARPPLYLLSDYIQPFSL